MQKINLKIYEEFEKEKSKLEKKLASISKQSKSNSNIPQGEWMKKICSVVKISELAAEHNITYCPICNYNLYFDDDRGWFICANERWNKKKCFSGNIVDFMRWLNNGNH
jgi:hypothetical protein